MADETGCMIYPLINLFGRDVCYGSTKALFSCIFKHKIHQMITQKEKGGCTWDLVIQDHRTWTRFLVMDTIIVRKVFKNLLKNNIRTWI